MRPNPADVFTLVLEKIYRRPPIPMGENDPETFVGQLARRYRSPLHGYRFELRTTHVRLMIESLNSSLHEIYIQIRGDIVLFERCLKSIFFFFAQNSIFESIFRFFFFLDRKRWFECVQNGVLRMRGDFCVYKNGKRVWVGYKDFLKKVNKNVGGNKSWKKIDWLALVSIKYLFESVKEEIILAILFVSC